VNRTFNRAGSYPLTFKRLACPIDVFFLQIQCSGRVRLRGGQVVRVGFAGRNGWPYVAIGKLLVDRGQLERTNVSMQSIRAWLEQHPAEAAGVMAENRSYVFFRELTGLGAKDRADRRTGRSLDPRALAGSRPRIHPARRARLGRHNGSTGRLANAAIDVGARHWRGDQRASPRDVFFGWGAEAEARAGRMVQHGRLFVLLPRPAAS
jgi:membrane-bound lytic murein transglycosylase A